MEYNSHINVPIAHTSHLLVNLFVYLVSGATFVPFILISWNQLSFIYIYAIYFIYYAVNVYKANIKLNNNFSATKIMFR